MKVAVTGASGFIGRHVLAALACHDVEVVAVTRNAERLTGMSDAVHILEMDISSPDPNCFDQMGEPDILLHLAWDGLPNYNSLHHFETELIRQYTFLKMMIKGGLSSLLVSGTCFEYGMQSGVLSEGMVSKPNNPYGYAKDALRKQLEFLKTTTSFNLTWARLFYMYGKGQPASSLYPLLKEAVSNGERSFNMSAGEQLRDYLPVEEVARKIVAATLAQRDIGAINICFGEPTSVRSLVEYWLESNDWEIALNFGYYPYPNYEPMAFWGSNQRWNAIMERK